MVNSAFFQEEEQRVMHDRVDLGIAVDLDQEGLIVMTVRGAETDADDAARPGDPGRGRQGPRPASTVSTT